jgi:hypothetical protein
MRRNNDDEFEQALRRAEGKQQNQDDVTIHSVVHKGKEVVIMEKRRDIQYIHDPEQGAIPITVNNIRYGLDNDGIPYSKSVTAASCKYGCSVHVKSLSVCFRCHGNICRRHTMRIGNRIYCKRGICWIAGKAYQLFLIIRFCCRVVVGLDTEEDDTHTKEEEYFESSDDVSEEEKK